MKWAWLGMITWVCLCGCERIKQTVGNLSKSSGSGSSGTSTSGATPSAATLTTTGNGMVTMITAADYDRVVQQQGKLVVVDFYADWCGPCRNLAPMMEKIAAEFGDKAVVVKLNVDQAKDIAQRENVRGIPDVRFFLDGKQVDKIVGLPPESDLRARFERHTGNIKTPSTSPKPQDAAAGSPAQPKKKEEAIKPMGKDWMPPGIQRK